MAKIKNIEEINGAKIFDLTPEYININGYIYEKQGKADDGCVNLELDLDDQTLNLIDEHMKKYPGYVNRQEVIREALRNKMKELEPTKKQKRK